MSKTKMKFKRSAVAVLTLALVCLFLLPVQAFAEGEPANETEGSLPAVISDEGGTSDGGSADAGAAEAEAAAAAPAAVPPGSAYLAPVAESENTEAESAPMGAEPTVAEPIAADPAVTDPVETEPAVTDPAVPDPAMTEPTEPAPAEPAAQTTEMQGEEGTPGGTVTDTSGDGDWTRYDNNESANAIQQAVDAALAAGQKYITVVVQDGTYTGGLIIDNSGVDENGNAKESIVVNIVAHDAYEHNETDSTVTVDNTSDGTGTTAGGEEAPDAVYPVPTVTNTNGDTVIDNTKINTGSAGGVKLEGGVSVKNVELLLAGIYLTLKEQQENQEAIESAVGEENNQDIQVENADNFTYYGTAQDDTVNISLTDVKNADIDSGDGADTLEITTTVSANVQLDTGKEEQVLESEFDAATSVNANINVSAGSGNDKITLTQNSTVVSAENDNLVSVRKGCNHMTVDAGDGADTITFKGGSNLVDIKYNISAEIAEKIYAIVSRDLADHRSEAVIAGGGDDDQLNLDTTFELGTLGKTVVTYDGGEGENRLHLTGALAEVESRVTGSLDEHGSGNISMYANHNVTRTEYSIVETDLWFNKTVKELELTSPNTLDIQMSGVDTLTDDLSGKKTIEVTIENGKVFLADENGNVVKDKNGKSVEAKLEAFTDYVYDPESDTVMVGSFTNTSAATIAGLLTKLIIRGQNLTVGEGVTIQLPGAILMLESTNGAYENGSILIQGTLEADTIMLKATSTDSNMISFVESDGETVSGMDPSIMDINTTATVTVASTARLIASRLVDILANTIQGNGLLPDLSNIAPESINGIVEKAFGFDALSKLKEAASVNFVSIKMASAMVNILGSIMAGSVRVNAINKVDTTASNSALRDIGLPFALSVILSEAGIKVFNDPANKSADYKGASITANTGDIYLDARSDVKVNTAALSGRLPFTVAVSVVDNKAYVDIDGGTLTSTDGNIIANATGVVNLKNSATGSNVRPNNNAVVPSTDHQASNTTTQLEMGKSGGFFAISVLTQDVFAALKGSASASAGGDITIHSTAKAAVVNNAASNPGEDGESMTLAKLILMLTGEEKTPGDGGIVGKIIRKITNSKNTDPSKSEEEHAAQNGKKTNVLGGFVKKLTGADNAEGDDVGSLVDKATTSANTGKTDSTKSVQLVGALGVTYTKNENKAYVDTTGTVNADGKLSVLADGELKVETLADGSPVEADDPAAGDDGQQDGPKDQHYAAHSHGAVKVDALTNGTILIDASVGSGADGICEIVQNNNFPKGIENFDTFSFVVKASFGYKLEADQDGKYWITNEYHRDSDNSTQTDQIEVKYVGKDADGCDLYRVVDAAGYKLFSGENLFKAKFVPKKSIAVENNATHMGTVTVSNTQKDGKDLYFADSGEVVYVTVNVKSGIHFTTPVITYISDTYDKPQPFEDKNLKMIDKDGNIITDLLGDVQEDGTINYYYKFEMPNGKVTMKVDFAGDDMNIKLGLEDIADRNSDVWITTAENEPVDNPMDQDAVYAGKVGDKIKIVIQLSQGTFLVKNSLMFAGKTPVYIKDITDDGNGQYTCYVNIPAILKTEGDSAAGKELKLTFQTTLDPNEAQGTVKNTSTALGAGLAVDVTRYDNQAYIQNGTGNQITADSVEVNANTSELSASAISKAGFVAGDLGVAGAITVHLVSANNEAYVGGTVNLDGGDLTVDSAIQTSNIVTNAEAAGDGANGENTDPDSVGVGAGIAVGVTNLAVVSRILENAVVAGTVGDLNINAGHTGSESMTATAGAAGGTSVVPVLAMNISGVSVLAEALGGNRFAIDGNALINAANSITRTITADAAAAGAGVGVGGSFIIDILNDSAKAQLNRGAQTGGNLTVSADSVSRLNATAKAGAQGNAGTDEGAGDAGAGDDSGASGEEPPPSDESDKKDEIPEDYYDGLDSLFGDNTAENEGDDGNTGGDTTENEEDDPESLAPLFREGDADKFVDSNKESAQDLSGLVENENGNVNEDAVGDAFENRQKAETSEGSVQIAATMVLNIQRNTALALICGVQNPGSENPVQIPVDAIVSAGSVTVSSRHDTDGVIMANASATNSTTGVGVAVAINTVTYRNIAEILANHITAENLTVRANVYESEVKETAENFFEALKNDLFGDEGKITGFINGILDASDEGTLHEFILQYFADRENDEETDSETETKEAEMDSDVVNAIAELICQWVGELLRGQAPSYPEESTDSQENADEAENAGEDTGASYGANEDQEETSEKTASENQIAQYAKEIFNRLKKEFSDTTLGAQLFDATDILINLKNQIKDLNLKEKAANALVSYLAGKLGGNEEAEGVGPKISTGAVSGAGATNVGVAGSVAISVVNGVSEAHIGKVTGNQPNAGSETTGQMNVSGNIVVESKASQDVYTSAGASVDALGRVDKNKDDTDASNSTQGDASNADASKSVGVGAAVAMSFADLTSNAGIGSGWTITAMDLLMDSTAENNVETTSVSGTDPLARTEDPTGKPEEKHEEKPEEKTEENTEKKPAGEQPGEEETAAKAMDYAVDASVAVTLIQNAVRSYLAENSVMILGGNLNMLSSQSGETNTNASGYAMGNATAVGAAVAINLAFSDVVTQLLGSGSVAGTASLDSRTENQDDATAIALAMGAEMDRYYAKIRNAEKVMDFNNKKDEENKKEENKNENEAGADEGTGETEGTKDLSNGEEKKDGKIENNTGNKISGQLKRASRVSDQEDEDKSNPSQPLSVQAIKSQNVKTESTNQTADDKNNSIGTTVTDATDSKTGDAVTDTLNEQAQDGQSIHVAASVGVNVTEHSAKTEIKGNLTVGGLKADVENTGNFSTASTGAAISEATNSNTVGAAVAVSVNGNKALIEIADGVQIVVTGTPATDTEADGDSIMGNVTLSTELNQNSTGDALRKYGALAISGSSSGKGGKVGLAGSVAMLVAKGTSEILLGSNVSITGSANGNTPAAGSVNIAASDMSKLSAAAMAATKSGGVTAGVGASFALLYAKNQVRAQAGDNFTVSAKDFQMTAAKQAVTISDFIRDADIRDYLTVRDEGGYSTENADRDGMIVVQKNENGTYSIITNLESADITSLIQLTSVLASVNYYASAVAGTIMERTGDTSNQKAAVAGAVSMLFNNSVTGVSIGDNAKITTTGDVKISASSDANTRLLGGALSSSGAKTGIGLNVATAVQNEQVSAHIGRNPTIHAGSFTLNAHSKSEMLVITAAAVNASGTSVGGALNVVINNNRAKANVESDQTHTASITTTGDVSIGADVISDVILGSVTAAISGSTDQGASVGAIVSVTTNASAAEALVGDSVTIISNSGAITVSATNEELVISVMAAAARSANGGTGAGTLSVLTTDAKAIAGVGNHAKLTADKDITVSAMSKAKLLDLMAAVSASTDAPAVGATIMVNVFNRNTNAYIGDYGMIISRQGNVLVYADSKETAIIISIAGAGASQNAISGNIQVNTGSSKTNATIGSHCDIAAWDSIGVTANQDSTVIAISPTVSYGSGSAAVGATVQTNILGSEVKALVGENANLVAYVKNAAAGGIKTANRTNRRKGIIVSALANDLVVAGGISAAAGKNSVSGVVETLINRTIVIAKIGENAVVRVGDGESGTADGESSETEGEQSAEDDSHPTLCVEADSQSALYLFGGAFSASSDKGVGATVLTLVYNKNVDAQLLLSKAHPSHVNGNVYVAANAEDYVVLVSVNFGVSVDAAVNAGGNVLVFQNVVNAELAGNLAATGNVTVKADNTTRLINAVASVSGGAAGVAVSGAALVTYYKGITTASVAVGSTIHCADLRVLATSAAKIDADGVGVTASLGGAAVSGLVNVIVTSTRTEAFIDSGCKIVVENIEIIATDHYDLLAVAVSLSGGSNGVGVTAVVTVAKNTVKAYINGNHTDIQCAALTVQAISNRNIRNYAGSVSGGVTAGAGVTVMVAVIGGKLDQDSADGIAQGFKPDVFLSDIQSAVPNAAKGYLNGIDLSADLEGDDSKASDLHVGDKNGHYSGTDDYRSDEFDKNYTSGTNPGENFSENVTNTQGSELGMAKPTGTHSNVIHAYIGSGCKITADRTTLIEANEKLNVDIVTAAAAVGGTAGVNVGVAVVVAYSNVLAEIRQDTELNCGDITVRAVSGGDGSIRDSRAQEVLNKAGIDADTNGNSIRVIAITVGIGGIAGVCPSVAVVNMASSAIARMDGISGSAGILTVKAEMVYSNVLAVTGAIGAGGSAGISGSVAVVTFHGDASAGVTNSDLTAAELNVLTNVDNTAKAYAMSLAGGGVGVNGGVAVVTNRSIITTILEGGRYTISGNVNVNSVVNTNAESYIVGVALGGVAVGLNAAVVNQHGKILTQILGEAAGDLTATGNVTVSNDITATAKSSVVSVVGGAVGVGGNVLLVFNNMEATAAIVNMPFAVTGNVTVSAGMHADSEATLTSGTVGSVAVGLSTSYVGLNAKNLAKLEIAQGVKSSAGSIRVFAGSANDHNSFHSTATTVAGCIGGVSVGLNAAVADINASNEAKILSKGVLTLRGGMDLQANADAAALAEIYFVSFGAINASAATAVSLLRIRQLAEADISSLDASGTFHVSAELNRGFTGDPSHAKLVTFGGGMYNASANVAVAYSLSKNIASAILNSASLTGLNGNIIVNAGGAAGAKSETSNQSAGAFNGSVFVNVAYAKGTFESMLRILNAVSANNTTVKTQYTANATAILDPAASKLNLSLASFNVNLAIARAASKALATLEGNGKLTLANNLNVIAENNGSTVYAKVNGASVDISGFSFATNVADAQMAMEQTVRVSGLHVETGKDATVQSNTPNAEVKAQTGSNYGVGIKLVGGKTDVASSALSLVNQLILENAKIAARGQVNVLACSDGIRVNAIADALTVSVSGLSAALTSTEATLKKLVNAIYINNSDISGSGVSVSSTAEQTKVNALSSVPSFSGSLIGADTVAATARIMEKLTQIIVGGGSIKSHVGNVTLNARADASMKAGTPVHGVSVGILSVKDYLFLAQADKVIAEVIFDSHMDSANDAELKAYDNIDADIRMDDTTIGAFSGVNSVAKINVKNQTAYVKAAGTISAVKNIRILAQADQHLVMRVNTQSANGIDMGYAQADIILYRNAVVDVDGDIISRLGNIDVKAQLDSMEDGNHIVYIDQDMNIDTWVDMSTYPTATGKLVSVAKVNVADGSLIQALNVFDEDCGTITIVAKNEGRVMVDIYRYVDKPMGGNRAYAIADVNETVQTIIGGGVRTRIHGKNVNIRALSQMDVRSKSATTTNVNLGIFSPNATTIYRLDMDTIIRDADLRAQNILNISAYILSSYIEAYCISDKVHLVGYNNPSVVIKGNIYADITFDKNTILKANELNVKTFEPYDANRDNQLLVVRIAESRYNNKTSRDTDIIFNSNAEDTRKAYRTNDWTKFSKDKLFVPGVFDPGNSKDKNLYYSGKLTWSAASSSGKSNATGKTEIYLGAGASGVYVDIAENGEIKVLGLNGSMDPDALVYEKNGVYHVDGSKLLAEAIAGKLSIKRDTGYGSYHMDQEAAYNDLTLLNRSGKSVQLDNVNQRADAHTNPGAFLNVTQTNANADLVFNGGGMFSMGSIYVDLAGGNLMMQNDAHLNAQNITIKGVAAVVNEGNTGASVEITNSSYTGMDDDAKVFLDVAEALDLLLNTENSRYTIGYIRSGSDLTVKVRHTNGKPVAVLLGELISGGNATITVPNSVESANPNQINITGNVITLNAGGKVGTSSAYLRIDSSANQTGSVTVTGNGGIYLKELDGDLYIAKIRNEGSGNIGIWTQNGSIHAASNSYQDYFSDAMEKMDAHILKYAEESVIVSDAEEMIRILLQYLTNLHRIRKALETEGEAVLETVKWEIDVLHYVTSVEEALDIIDEELRYIGGTDYQNPETGKTLMDGALQDEQITDAFNAEANRLASDKTQSIGGMLGEQMVAWRDAYQESDKHIQAAVENLLSLLMNTVNISGNGDLHLHVQSATGVADISQTVNTLTISVGGKVTITSAQDTVLKDVYLESYKALKLDPIVATHEINLYSLDGIYAATKSNQVLLDADRLVLHSLMNGDLGTASQALILKANLLDALGNYVYLENRKDLVVELLLAMEDLYLTVKGNLNDLQGDAVIVNGIHGNGVTLQVSGDIGCQGENVSISAEKALNITARNLYMISDGDVLVGTIRTNGMVSIDANKGSIQNADQGSGIWCDSMNLSAYGMIGTKDNPLMIHSNGVYTSGGGGLMRMLFRAGAPKKATLIANSYLYGENIHIIPVVNQKDEQDTSVQTTMGTVSDIAAEVVSSHTGIRVSGKISGDAVLVISHVSDHADCSVCQALMQQHQRSGQVFVTLKLIGNYAGKLLVQIPVNEMYASYEGKEILILTCRDGVVWAIRATVTNGYITFLTKELGSFLILGDPAQLELTEDGKQILLDQQLLPFGGWL